MNNYLVSIIIPIYKVSKYLDKCVLSAVSQTYQNLEIILVDDGSPDDCPAICDTWAKKDSRIQVIHKTNGGLSDARNAGLDKATGKFICFLDGDDYIEPDLIAEAISHMINDVGLVAFGHYREKNNCTSKILGISGLYRLDTDEKKVDFFLRTLLQYRIGWEAWGRFFRRDIIEKYHLRFADNRVIFTEDLYFSLCYCAHIQKAVYLPNCLYHYIIREDSIMDRDLKKINIGRMNELSKAVNAHYTNHPDCTALLNVYPVIHYLIIDNSIQQMLNAGYSMREIRNRILEYVQDYSYFITQTKNFLKFKTLIYQITDSWKATNRLNTCRYIISGSYIVLRIRNLLLSLFPKYFERISSQAKRIIQE